MHVVAQPLPPFWSLVEAHGPELLGHARRLAGPTEAEDVLQEAFLRALRAYPRLRHGEHLRAWLYRITTNVAFDHAARNGRRRELPLDAASEPAAPPDRAPAAEDDAFAALIATLPEGTREALALRFVDDLPYDQIARRLGCSPAAARQRVSTAVRTLRGTLAP